MKNIIKKIKEKQERKKKKPGWISRERVRGVVGEKGPGWVAGTQVCWGKEAAQF